jgi:hypothetical protein
MVQTNGETRPQKSTSAAQRLLSALADMASRSTRVQADLGAAMRQAKLLLGADQIVAALAELEIGGYVAQIVPLGDGGTLVSVTASGAELVRAARRRAAFDQIIMMAPI